MGAQKVRRAKTKDVRVWGKVWVGTQSYLRNMHCCSSGFFLSLLPVQGGVSFTSVWTRRGLIAHFNSLKNNSPPEPAFSPSRADPGSTTIITTTIMIHIGMYSTTNKHTPPLRERGQDRHLGQNPSDARLYRARYLRPVRLAASCAD